MAKKQKYYVVWSGHNPGVYKSWQECQEQIQGFKGADYKSFKTLQEAQKAFETGEIDEKTTKTKYYVVWKGHHPGVYNRWGEAQEQIAGFPNAEFKTFGSKDLAYKAFKEGPEKYKDGDFKKTKDLSVEQLEKIGNPIEVSLSVDAACNAKTGQFEYRGVWTHSRDEVFKVGPYPKGSNNIGEFLALVHALAFLKKENAHDLPIYTDSRIAMNWLQKKTANPKTAGPKAKELIKRAEHWIKNNTWKNPILKWETKVWGEIPADFGRK